MMVKEMLGFEQCYLSDSFVLMRRHLKKASFLSKDLFLAKLYFKLAIKKPEQGQ